MAIHSPGTAGLTPALAASDAVPANAEVAAITNYYGRRTATALAMGDRDNAPFAYDNFINKPDGVPGNFLTGQAWQQIASAGSPQRVLSSVSGGALIANDSGQSTTLSYSGLDLLEDISGMYAEVAFGGSGNNSAAAVLIATNAVAINSITNWSIHIQFAGDAIRVGYFTGNTLTPLAVYTYTTPIPKDNIYRVVGWRIVGTSLFILGADGVERECIDANWPAHNGNAAVWEHATAPTTGQVFFRRVWAVSLASSAKVNLFTQPSLISDAAWTKSGTGTIVEAQLDADGGALAEFIPETAASTFHQYRQNVAKAASAKRYRASRLIKMVNRQYSYITVSSAGGNAIAYFDHNTGLVGANSATSYTDFVARMIPAANGFYRTYIDFTSDADTVLNCFFGAAATQGVQSFLGSTSAQQVAYDHRLVER